MSADLYADLERIAPLVCDAIDNRPDWEPGDRCAAYAELDRLAQLTRLTRSSSATSDYAAMQDAFLCAAREYGLRPFEVRLLMALDDRGGGCFTPQELAKELLSEAAAIRRATLRLNATEFIAIVPPSGVQRKFYTITDKGRRVVMRARKVLAQTVLGMSTAL